MTTSYPGVRWSATRACAPGAQRGPVRRRRNVRLVRTSDAGQPGPVLVDLTHPVEDGMVTYPGLPGPQITDHLSWEASHANYAAGTEFQIGRISMVANTGTYLDAPAHRHRGAADLSEVPLDRVADVPGLVVDATSTGPAGVDRDACEGLAVRGRAVPVRTGWDVNCGTPAAG